MDFSEWTHDLLIDLNLNLIIRFLARNKLFDVFNFLFFVKLTQLPSG
jgi:hypothetical protein